MEKSSAWRWSALLVILFVFVIFSILFPLATVWLSVAEYLHLCSYVFLAELLYKNKGWKGISYKSQYLVILMVITRYFDILIFPKISIFAWLLKASFIVVALGVSVLLYMLRDTYEKEKDTANFLVFTLLALVLGLINFLVVSTWKGVGDFIWVFSHYLQTFALIPQFIFSFRDGDNQDNTLNIYIFLLGGYRLLYFLHWISYFIAQNTFYFAGPLSLLIYIPFLLDFMLFKYLGHSPLSERTLRLDEKLSNFKIPLLSNRDYELPRSVFVDVPYENDQEGYSIELGGKLDNSESPHKGVPLDGKEFHFDNAEYQLDEEEDPHFSTRRF
ncbi:putative KDEL endoplasmic reticulum proteinretention receptor 2 (KDELR2) [Cardiosporidium cionae]|uniref:KDEL endoplasmic reticulum proteinretention receptor 2 (KDELR2) n=1 Tax=Cardiosporidium cionae TaxID=476202 RepID=A0ABQ7J4F4_9APIC|nr:putative KDEL endoplasmic reticulum proteinretention receptor 2 (KDELR2) [Cardiosporidium cionae]|eukprot:KAF8817958.1 putative KDEL endoplasmic reticulum proteinretention receptor 2 (KDELR2) [Cardiosporidium cionae]